MGCRKLTYHQEPAIGASWEFFISGKEKTASTPIFCIDYYAFGMQMPGRNGSTGAYRYGFQGQEKDDEIKGEGNSVNYTFRMHDPRVGRFLSLDPLAPDYPHNSPYVFSENRVIDGIEIEGLEFLDSDEGLIFMQRGQLFLRTENDDELKEYVQSGQATGTYANYPQVQYSGLAPAGGRAIKYKLTELQGPDGSKNQQTTEQEINSKVPLTAQSGKTKTDKRFKQYMHETPTIKGARGLLILNVYSLAMEGYKGWSGMFKSMERANQMTEVFDETMKVINYALANEMIPTEHLNETSMDHLFNVVMFGGEESGPNKTPTELRELGVIIYDIFQDHKGGPSETVERDYESVEENGAVKADATRVNVPTLKPKLDE